MIAPLPEQLFAAALDLWEDCGLTRPWNVAGDDLRRAMRGPASTVLACMESDRLLGTAMVGHDGHRGWVYYLAVRADARGRGLGRALMSACEEWVSGHGMPTLRLMVRTGNEPVLAFYERLGYEPSDVVVLGRRLDG